MLAKRTVVVALPPFFCRRRPPPTFGTSFKISHYSSASPGKRQVDCGSGIQRLIRRIRDCAEKLGGGWERDKAERTAKLYDDDGHGIDVGLRLLPLAAVIMAARVLPPQTNRRRMTKTCRV